MARRGAELRLSIDMPTAIALALASRYALRGAGLFLFTRRAAALEPIVANLLVVCMKTAAVLEPKYPALLFEAV